MNKIHIDFLNLRAKVETSLHRSYIISFIDKKDGRVISSKTSSGEWVEAVKTGYTDWRILIRDAKSGEELPFDFDLKGKRVSIINESPALGDLISWIPAIDLFQKKHECIVDFYTPCKFLFLGSYPNINLLDYNAPKEYEYYVSYGIGYFESPGELSKRDQCLQKTAFDILGLDYKETQPIISPSLLSSYNPTQKYVCIAMASTSGSKHWQRENGWQDVTNYLIKSGYKVVCIQKEDPDYQDLKVIKGVEYVTPSLGDCIPWIQNCDFFIGVSSGLSWLAWGVGVKTILISGFTDPSLEFDSPYRVINTDVCHGCWTEHKLDKNDWEWCPKHKGTPRQFECSKEISFEMVKEKIDDLIKKNNSSLL